MATDLTKSYLMKKTLAAIFITTVIVFVSCKKDSNNLVTTSDMELDQELLAASNNAGRLYYIMPESNDFRNIPQDPNNHLNQAKVELGKMLFHETGLGSHPKYPSGMHTYSCASCHFAAAGFQANMAQSIGDGGMAFGISGEGRHQNPDYPVDSVDVQPVRSPSAMNLAYQDCIVWNGQFGATGPNAATQSQWTAGTPIAKNFLGYEGLETQAIAAQDVHRLTVDTAYVASIPMYKSLYDQAFSELPANQRITQITTGLAIAAYERTLLANKAPFQQWLKGDNTAMTETEKKGAILFFGKANCYACHNGPALSSMAFYGLGMKEFGAGVSGVLNPLPARVEHKGRGGFTGKQEDMYKYKVPQLYNMADSKFYGHGASFHSIRDVVVYKNNAVPEDPNVPTSQLAAEFVPLNLNDTEIDELTAFMEKSLYDPDLQRYAPSALPSGFCFPNNDPQSKSDEGCN